MDFTHIDKNGNAIMVDISDKDITDRVAVASGYIKLNEEIISSIKNISNKKGDVLSVARIAGIMAVKIHQVQFLYVIPCLSINAQLILK